MGCCLPKDWRRSGGCGAGGKGREERDESGRVRSGWQAGWVQAPRDAWDQQRDKEMHRWDAKPKIHGAPWPCSPRTRACPLLRCTYEHPARTGGARGTSGFAVGAGICDIPQGGNPSRSHTPTQHLHVRTVAHTQPLHARTHASELLPQAWERTCGPESWAAFIFLLPPSSSWLLGPPGESQSLSPPTPPTHTHARGRLAARPELSCKR